MKKVLLSLLAVAALVLSCQNYDDEFDALNAKVSSLESQISSLQGLQAALTSVQSNVTALQSAVNAIPDPSSSIAALATSIAEILTELGNLETAVAGASTSTELEALKSELEDQIAALNALVASNSTELDTLGVDVTSILGTVNTYTGALNITNSAELAFALNLGGKVASITGAVTVNTTNLTAAEVTAANTVTSKIQTVVGAVSITSSAAKGAIDVSALKVVDGAYSVTGVDAHDDALETVTGAVALNYDGGYEQPNLKSAASVALTNFTTAVGPPAVVGTVKVNFRNLVTADLNTGAANTLTLPSATSVIVNKGATTITANAATDVQVWNSNNTTGLTVSATKAGSVVTIAGRVDSGAAVPVGQALSITGSATSIVNADAVVKVGAVAITAKTVNMAAMTDATSLALTSTSPVSFGALKTSGAITANSAISVTAPLAVVSAASSFTLATSLEFSSIAHGDLTAPAVKSLKLNSLAVPFDATAYTTLTDVDVTGKAASTGAFTAVAANSVLASAKFAGELDAVSVTGPGGAADKLTSFTTAGNIDSVTLVDNNSLVSATLGHSHIAGGAGSVLVVTGNDKLASLTSSANFLLTLTVTGNVALTTLDLSSYTSVVSTGAIAVSISNNKLTGTFTAAKAATATTAYSEASIGQSSLLTLKPFIAAYKAATTAPAVSTATITLDVQVEDVDAATAGNQSLAAAMHANEAVSTVIASLVNTEGINTVAEFLLIQ